MSVELLVPHTWYHGVKSLQVLVSHSALITHFVHEAVNKAHHRVRHIRALCIFKAALCVVAFGHTACNTTKQKKVLNINGC